MTSLARRGVLAHSVQASPSPPGVTAGTPFAATPDDGDVKLIETLRLCPRRGLIRRALHLERLQASAALLGFRFERTVVAQALAGVPVLEGPRRVRLTLDRAGRVEVTHQPCPELGARWRFSLASGRLDSADPWLRVKSTHRTGFDAARAALPAGIDECVFLNERDEICEGTITSIFLRIDGRLLTPPLASGLMPGVLRRALLDEGAAVEAVLRRDDLARAEAIYLGNSLRGLIPSVWSQEGTAEPCAT